ncbi:hypothetical protein [Mesorhizobium amorphae]|uniref:hypothetical protein n=1 Tax=Mesorhizobium amorphae TaxID=71433 RepID=UPI0021B23CB4|nr:hypothetical protein [Mesorhizobium amorphae]
MASYRRCRALGGADLLSDLRHAAVHDWRRPAGRVSVSAGCFTDPDFAPPATLFRARRKHRWFDPGPRTRISD